MVARWQASGEAAATFARKHGIGRSTFRLWIDRHRLAVSAGAKESPAFLQVVDPTLPTASTTVISEKPEGLFLAVDGLELRFPSVPSPAWFGAMLREYSRC
jgi:transposase-like protein